MTGLTAFKTSQELEIALIESRGELTPELEQKFGAMDLAHAESIDAAHLMIERLEHTEEYWNNKAHEAAAIAKSVGGWAARLRNHIKQTMISAEQKDLVGIEYRFKLSSSKPKVVINEDLLPKEYFREKIELVVDKARIAEDLRLGVPVPGAALEDVFSLRDYPVKKELK